MLCCTHPQSCSTEVSWSPTQVGWLPVPGGTDCGSGTCLPSGGLPESLCPPVQSLPLRKELGYPSTKSSSSARDLPLRSSATSWDACGGMLPSVLGPPPCLVRGRYCSERWRDCWYSGCQCCAQYDTHSGVGPTGPWGLAPGLLCPQAAVTSPGVGHSRPEGCAWGTLNQETAFVFSR